MQHMGAMRRRTALVLAVSATAADAAGGSPIQKVVGILRDIEAKIITEGTAEQKTYEEFSAWCQTRSRDVKHEQSTSLAEIEDLKAAIEQATAGILQLTAKIEDAADDLTKDGADLKEATAIREREAADFSSEEKDLVEVTEALERAVGVLEREARKGGDAMVQIAHARSVTDALRLMVGASMMQAQDASRLSALLQSVQQDEEDAEDEEEDSATAVLEGAPSAAAYESKSGSIVDVLQDLLDKAKGQLEAARKKEQAARHNFEMLKQSLTDEMKFGEREMEQAKKGLAATKESKATAEGDLAVTSKAFGESKSALVTLRQDCVVKSQEFEAATKSRAQELKALKTAQDAVLESTERADDITYGDGAGGAPTEASFLQRRSWSGVDLANFEAVRFLRNLARKTSDPLLMQLARRMASVVKFSSQGGGDPFAKVKDLITDMIAKLEKDGQTEASHKSYCDKELGETEEKKGNREAELRKLNTGIDSMTARSAQFKEEVASHQKALADLTQSQGESDRLRREEHAQFETESADVKAGIDGVKLALSVLNDYYSNAGGAAHDAASGSSTGVIGMLEIAESDFSKKLAELNVNEHSSKREYDEESQANTVEKATTEQDIKYKSKEAVQLDSKIVDTTSDRDSTQTELAAVTEYSAKLQKMCVAKPDTYTERSARLDAELSGLREALSILEGEAVLLQGRGRGLRRGQHPPHRALAWR